MSGVLSPVIRLTRRAGKQTGILRQRVYTEPVYYALCQQDFTEVAVINPAYAKALRGHKTDPSETVPGWRSCSSAGCCAGPASRRRS
jgi:hypothetical protein